MIEPDRIVNAIAAHATWKHRLRQAISSGQSEWTPAEVRVDDGCDFGRWLRSLPPSERIGAHWKSVHGHHADFHRAAAEVLDLALARRTTEAEAAIAPGSRFDEISKQLTLAMMAWQKAVKRGAPKGHGNG